MNYGDPPSAWPGALERVSEREESERRILKLELENQLLRAERGLPPAKPEPDDE